MTPRNSQPRAQSENHQEPLNGNKPHKGGIPSPGLPLLERIAWAPSIPQGFPSPPIHLPQVDGS